MDMDAFQKYAFEAIRHIMASFRFYAAQNMLQKERQSFPFEALNSLLSYAIEGKIKPFLACLQRAAQNNRFYQMGLELFHKKYAQTAHVFASRPSHFALSSTST